ncbi:MAG: hypothetical protein KC646_03200 [Candidatus Cloacimonetes bacterium]|nr:hypothetical protein [Candidatus Cloacimonadota bacterium]
MKLFFVSLILIAFIGCGASTGTGLDTVAPTPKKSVTISEILAVDDKIIGGSVIVGTSIDAATGKIVSPLDIQSLATDSSGKIGSFSFNLDTNINTLYFQVSGGTNGNGGPAISPNSSFLGAMELDGTGNLTQARVNISPLSTLIAYTKNKSPNLKLSNITGQAVSKMFQSTAVGVVDINSATYLGNTSTVLETNGEGPLFQLVNEMIKLAAKDSAGTGADQISNFVQSFNGQITAGSNIFEKESVVLTKISTVSSDLSTNSAGFSSFFSQSLSILSTSSASFKPSAFTSKAVEQNFVLSSVVYIDNVLAKINSVSDNTAFITASDGSALVLTSLPKEMRFLRTNLDYKSELDTSLYFLVKKASNDYFEAEITPTKLDAKDVFQIIFPAAAKITGTRVEPTSSFSTGILNQGEDKFPSSGSYITIPIDQFIKKGEGASGVAFPSFSNQTLDIDIHFDQNVKFKLNSSNQFFYKFKVNQVQIQ